MQTRSLCVRFGIGLRPPRGGVGDSRGSRTSDESVCCLNLFTVDFKKGADKKVGRRFFDRKANGVSSARDNGLASFERIRHRRHDGDVFQQRKTMI
jgi:hypothetical protein